MKQLVLLLLFILPCLKAGAQKDNPKYDKTLAESLGGDDYGMKAYVLVILKTGTATITDKKISDSLFGGHLANIIKLASEKKLVVSGPLKKNDKAYRGIFILNVKTTEEAKALLAGDPAINARLLDAELFQWYGSAALPEYLKIHDKIQKNEM